MHKHNTHTKIFSKIRRNTKLKYSEFEVYIFQMNDFFFFWDSKSFPVNGIEKNEVWM